jgi:hypothetical protein
VLHVRAAKGLEDSVAARVRVPFGQGFAGGIIKERRPRIWNDVHYDEVVSDYIREKGIRALAGVPLVSADDSVLGVLHVGRITPRGFGDEDIRILQLAAERVALAVEHAARREAERRGRELAEASNRAKDEFLAMLGHELRNPLSAIRNAVATASLDESRRARSLDIARRQAEQLARLIDDLLDVSRITQGKIALRKERVYLAEVLDHAVRSIPVHRNPGPEHDTGGDQSRMSPWSRILALSQWRCTVRSDTPRMAAISAKLKPQKNFRSTSCASGGSSAVSCSSALPIRSRCSASSSAPAGSSGKAVIWNSPPRFCALRART